MPPRVDLVVVFRAVNKPQSKQQALQDARKAEEQYSRLLEALKGSGLRVVGRRGETQGHLLVFVSCPLEKLANLIRIERHSDFLSGLPLSNSSSSADPKNLSPADRIRLVYGYVTCIPRDGGLGIVPGSTEWDLVESVMTLHDREFNETWIRSWTTSQLASVKLDKIRDQFGDSIALYFSFLSSYTQALVFPSVLGLLFYIFSTPYSATYSTLLFIWSVVFVEWWSVRERVLAVRWGTRGSFRVEKRRAQYKAGFPWWKRELRMLASVPVILLFVAILAALLTCIFVFEAFVTHLYTGPGQKYISFSPTIFFIALVPRVLAIYQASAKRFTAWENHAHQSTHDASLTLKIFALTAIVAYLGLGLSAFVYVPFGASIMHFVQGRLFEGDHAYFKMSNFVNNTLSGDSKVPRNGNGKGVWQGDSTIAQTKLNPLRLRDQMFAYTVTNQVINTFVEIGLPFVLRFVSSSKIHSGKGGKKRVVFEDEVTNGAAEKSKEEREFLEIVRKEVALPEYDLFGDYSEMVTQFGYVALWSTIWPLAPVMALANNFLELRSDAFKITVHSRRPIPTRTDTIGPWLSALTFLSWLSALTNASLVYLFRPAHLSLQSGSAHSPLISRASVDSDTRGLVISAALIALAASHGYFLLRMLVRHAVERVVWTESHEVLAWEKSEREVKVRYLDSVQDVMSGAAVVHGDDEDNDGDLAGSRRQGDEDDDGDDGDDTDRFWLQDEGLEEIQRIGKQA